MVDSINKMRREIARLGWRTERTRGGHLRCAHPRAAHYVYTASTPSDYRAWKNLQAAMKRALAAGAARDNSDQIVM
jgi:predicted RNA binding protein YcfA (HicA-like mRNA interferase family)